MAMRSLEKMKHFRYRKRLSELRRVYILADISFLDIPNPFPKSHC